MRTARILAVSGLVVLTLASMPAAAMDAHVPTILYPDVQAAVAALSVSPDVDNHIFIDATSITTANSIVLTNAFNAGRQLTISPGTVVARAQIRSTGVGAPIFSLQQSGFVTLRELDILRVVTNTADLIQTVNTATTLIERCRIGSNEPPGPAGLSYVNILYPGDGGVTIRNCICFSTSKLAFDYGIRVMMGDATNELRLLNDCVADYNAVGLQVIDASIGSLVLLRNNLFVNNVVSFPEPVAVHSQVGAGVIVVTSHNLAFASPPNVQTGVPPNLDVFGTAATQVPIDLPATAPVEAASFATMVWAPAAGAPNPDFYRTLAAGPLHDSAAKWGLTVGLASPDPHDVAVVDDFDRSIRPGGAVLHVDRGPFQVDPSLSGVPGPIAGPSLLRVAPAENPARTLRLEWASEAAGDLSVELFDAAGRRVGAVVRTVEAGAGGSLAWPEARAAGVYAWRARLAAGGRILATTGGRLSLVR